MMTQIDCRVLQGDQLIAAGNLLADSFSEDPTVSWMLQKSTPGFEVRVKTYMSIVHHFYLDMGVPIIGAFVNHALQGVVYGGYFDDVDMQSASTYWVEQINHHFTGTVLSRVLEYEQSMNDEIPPQTYLLGLIAVAESARGQGVGTALIHYVINQCKNNEHILRIMLDTANMRNIDLYERLGFKAITVKAFDEHFCETVMAYSVR